MAPVHGYKYRSDIPLCPCKDPGNYVRLESTLELLVDKLICWCGATTRITYENAEEREAFRKAG